MGVGAKRVRKVLAAIDNGGITFVDRRTFNTGRAKRSSDASGGPSQNVDAFLNWVYEHLAELLAEATPSDDNPYLAREVDLPDEPLPADEIEEKDLAEFCATIDGLTPACDKEQKWLAPTTMKELYDLMATWQGKQHVPSFTTFICVYKRLWKKTLKIREIGQHARCARCAELSAWLAKEHDPQKRADIMATRDAHLSSMLSDRDLEERPNFLSEASCTKAGPGVGAGRILKKYY